MSQESSVSVLVLFHQRPEQTVECLESFLPSEVPIYVLNNGSCDKAVRYVKQFASSYRQIEMFDSPRNIGVAAGRNFLIKQSKEEWLFFVDNDATVTTRNWKELLQNNIASHKDADAFVPRIFHAHLQSDKKWGDIVIEAGVLRQLPRIGPETNIFCGTAIVSRRFFDRLGGYDEEMFVGFEDLEISVRALTSGCATRAIHLDEIELRHEHRRALTAKDRKAAIERYRHKSVEHSFLHLLQKYNLSWEHNWKEWVDVERQRVTGDGPVKRALAAAFNF